MRDGPAQLGSWCRTVLLALVPLLGTASCRAAGASLPDAGVDLDHPDARDDGTAFDAENDAPSFDAAEDAAPSFDAAEDAAAPDGVPEKRCGESPPTYFSARNEEMLAKFSDCTVLVGHFQEDSVRDLMDLAALSNVRRVEGNINIFRSPGFVTLHGLENLEEVQGNFSVHMNDNLRSIAALRKLRTVTGNLYILLNPMLPQSEVDELGARVAVGGMKTLVLPAAQ